MPKAGKESFQCQICKQEKKKSEVVPGSFVRNPIVEKIKQTVPAWSPEGYICLSDLNRFRAEYVQSVIEEDKGQLSTLEEQVVESMKDQDLITKNLNLAYEQQLTTGQRMADKIADFGGSWPFIGIFGVVLILWMLLNSILLITKPFDPYPFIFLNLILSCLAAIQAPIIMMSQNRQEERDRIQAEHDYQINLKAELEIRHLHEKLDHLLMNQWQRLLEIQEIQMELMEEIAHKNK
ncbi:MAG TPA: DUF1003 domain-containing protein [Bacteroidales bacterium]|nr:DUF1003 domain-containing protein [Bacteroidales bacterium]